MERDFLGVGGKDAAVREEAGFLGRSPVHWPFSGMVPVKHQFMNFQAAQEERSKNIMFDQFSSSGLQTMSTVDAFTTSHRSPSVASQKHSGMDRQGIHQFQLPAFPARGADPFGVSAANHPIEARTFPLVPYGSFALGTGSPFFKASGSANGSTTAIPSLKQQHPLAGGLTGASPAVGSMTSSFDPRNITKPSGAPAQLTIFYSGSVSVYDDVPLEKAQAIMLLASNVSNMNLNAGNVTVQTPLAVTTKVVGIEKTSINQTQTMKETQIQINPTQASSMLSSPISTASHSGAQSGSGSNATDSLTGAKSTRSLAPTGQQEPPKAIVNAVGSASSATLVTRAVPQARKASLTRFLEKRKERVMNVAPYPLPQKTPQCTSGFDGKSVTAEAAHSSSMEQSWCFNTQKNSSESSNSLSTKLEI